jgi:hypothetical protein
MITLEPREGSEPIGSARPSVIAPIISMLEEVDGVEGDEGGEGTGVALKKERIESCCSGFGSGSPHHSLLSRASFSLAACRCWVLLLASEISGPLE